ncbi:division/cell wall cluster transcriptional repressor MraZ [Thermodesulfobacterium hydrogeniphilum]|uniref:division/cell wall cluster transcriptional repressor MraZ n=1 Tax=Thermodesulfobacterium hydrogeniphilum TaxID=161156 RepID=UPI00056E25B0|nr:division/cell wall cluster transcriptional repressor MraZ [Thermodesulfobacterium hydrogeniphilum]
MFRGKFKHNIDNKGRFSLPSKFREVLRVKYGSENLVITNYPDCLVAYPIEEWQKIEEKLLSLPWDVPEVRQYVRYFLGSAEECQPDRQGRILLPQSLREEIKLEKEVILLGMLNHFEIWNPKDLEERFRETKSNFNQIMQIINPYLTGVKNLPS